MLNHPANKNASPIIHAKRLFKPLPGQISIDCLTAHCSIGTAGFICNDLLPITCRKTWPVWDTSSPWLKHAAYCKIPIQNTNQISPSPSKWESRVSAFDAHLSNCVQCKLSARRLDLGPNALAQPALCSVLDYFIWTSHTRKSCEPSFPKNNWWQRLEKIGNVHHIKWVRNPSNTNVCNVLIQVAVQWSWWPLWPCFQAHQLFVEFLLWDL